MPERIGYLGRAQEALQQTNDPKDTEYAKIIESIISLRGGDVFGGERPAREALARIDAHEPLGIRLNNVLASFNLSPKTVTFLLLSDIPANNRDMYRSYREAFAGSDIHSFTSSAAAVEYTKTLMQFGMAEEIEEGFVLSEEGKKYRSVAAKFLDYEKTENTSLYPVFGQASATKDQPRAPLSRARILLALASGKKATELPELLGLQINHVADVLKDLRVAGVVNFDLSLDRHSASVSYKRPQGHLIEQVVFDPHKKKITQLVIDACNTMTDISTDAIFSKLPPEYVADKKISYLKQDIAKIIKTLADAQLLQRIAKSKLEEIDRNLELTTAGSAVTEKLLIPLVDALTDGPILQKWTEDVLPKVTANLNGYATTTAELYKPVSVSARRRQMPFVMEDIAAYVELFADEFDVTLDDVTSLSGIPKHTAFKILAHLVRQQRLKKRVTLHHTAIFSPNSDHVQEDVTASQEL